jgi:DNA repair protein RadD
LVRDFHAQKFKYLVSVGTMTTGVDFTHVDVIAILRATESISLMQQMIGRGLRLHEGKDDCLLLDFAGNVERHSPDGDIFRPQVKTRSTGERDPIEAICPLCERVNIFSARKNEEGYGVDEYGYFTLADGSTIDTEYGAMPAHFGRRCCHEDASGKRCSYRWTFKECEACGADNDIAARYCSACKGEIVDPNKKLIVDFKRLKRDISQWQCDEVKEAKHWLSISRSTQKEMRVVEVKAGGRRMRFYFVFGTWKEDAGNELAQHIDGGTLRTITYRKRGDFYEYKRANETSDKAILDEKMEML